MLKTRIIPTLLWKNYGLVKGKSFNSWRRVGTILPAVKVYNTRDVDELILVDILATQENRDLDYQEISDICDDCFVPLTVGGGIKNLDQISKALKAGADKICLNSIAYSNPKLISQAAKKFGSQCIVVSIDAKKMNDEYFCMSHSGKTVQKIAPKDFAKECEDLGAGEILLTSVDQDGTMTGYDLNLIQSVSQNVKIPVIASGGAGSYQHMHQAYQHGAQALAAAAIFHYTEQTPKEAKKYLYQKGVPVRYKK